MATHVVRTTTNGPVMLLPRHLIRPFLAVVLALAVAGCESRRPTLVAPLVLEQDEYKLDAGDKLRITVFEQDTLSGIYEVGATGGIAFPLIGDLRIRGRSVAEVEAIITTRLASSYVRNPSVSAEVVGYRPIFVLGEVTSAGSYPYVPGMTAEMAVATAGGFTPRANQRIVRLTRRVHDRLYEDRVPSFNPIEPGDTIYVFERLL